MRNNIIITIIIFLITSCSKDEDPEPVKVERTIIACMAADNDLWDVALVDLEEMKQGYRETGV
ncbi:MAG: peptidase C11, partial [Prevotellaceae bacterium]|nr:peptidase C11 [Prevotellaceae bacterium]